MSRRKDLLKLVLAIPAAIIGSKLAVASTNKNKCCGDDKHTLMTRIHTSEIDKFGTIVPNGRAVFWNTTDPNWMPKVGRELLMSHEYDDHTEDFQVVVTSQSKACSCENVPRM